MIEIGPDLLLRILLPVEVIPEGSTVSKRTGEYTYVLKRNLKIYGSTKEDGDKKPMVIDGFFLVNERGDINQVAPGTLLHWNVTTLEFVNEYAESWGIDQ
jgi:hypothetical protein